MKKKCGKCKTDKPRDDFSINNLRPDGKQDWCKKCLNEKNKQYKKVDWLKLVIG